MVQAWRDSGLPAETFAREHGVGAWRLRYWAPLLEEKARSESGAKDDEAMRFVPAIATAASGAAIVVRLPDGIEVELRDVAEVEPEEIGRLVAELRKAGS